MPESSYNLAMPAERTTSVVFASPHSGCKYPRAFLRGTVLNEMTIRSSEDAFVDLLFADAPAFGAPLLSATAPRAFIDLNRAADELDPAVVEGVRNSRCNPRVTSGLGVIPRVVASGRAIYRRRISLSDARNRVLRYWRPYHERLGHLMSESHRRFGQAILIDCHSMPRGAAFNTGRRGRTYTDVVLGDRFGISSASGIMDQVETAFRSAGLSTVRNVPFAGAYILKQYGIPSVNRHAIQVEIDRSLYMDEETIRPNVNFAAFKALVSGVIRDLTDIGRPETRMAAE